jgi:hypothetical protein
MGSAYYQGPLGAAKGVVAITANLLVLTPWLIFGAGLAVVCYRLLSRRASSHRRRRDDR